MNNGTVTHTKKAAPRKRPTRAAEKPKASSPVAEAPVVTQEATEATALATVVASQLPVKAAEPAPSLPMLWTRQAETLVDLAYDMQALFVRNSLSFLDQVSPRSARVLREWTDLLGWS